MVHPQDMDELRRMVTNLYDPDKSCIIRVLQGINVLEGEIARLKRENKDLMALVPKQKVTEGVVESNRGGL